MAWNSLEFITGRIQKRLEGFYVTDDTLPSLNLIADEVHKARGDIIANAKFLMLPHQYYQKVCCLEVKCENEICNGVKTGRNISYIDLGTTVMAKWEKQAIRFVGVEGVFSMQWRDNAKATKSPYIKSKSPYYTLNGTHLNLYDMPTQNVQFLCVEALLSDPMAAFEQSTCEDTWDAPYPFPADELGMLEDIVIKRLAPSKGIKPDYNNNAKNQ